IYACAVFMGVGLAGLLEITARRSPAQRAWLGFAMLALMLGGAALTIVLSGRLTNRLPAPGTAHPWAFALHFPVLWASAGAAAVRALRRAGWPRALLVSALPALIVAGLVLSLIAVTFVRVREFASQPVIGESYGAEFAGGLPPGAVLMTQGDGFLFTMWYES